MKQELVRVARKVGTSAGVILPIGLLGATVKVSVLEEPVNPLMDSLRILEKHKLSSDVLSIGLTGSYARQDNGIGSDVDILVISKESNVVIEEGKYSIIVISKDQLIKEISEDVIYYSMVQEAIGLINGHLLDEMKKIELSKDALKGFVRDSGKFILKAWKMIKIDRKLGNNNTGDSVAYSLVLRIRSLMILNGISEGKKFRNRSFVREVGEVMYGRYKFVKDGKIGNKTPIVEAVRLIGLLEDRLERLR